MKARKIPKVIEVWAVHQGDDDRSSGHPEWFFTTKEEAKRHAAKRGWYGGEAPYRKRHAYDLGDGTVFILDDGFPEPVMLGYSEESELLKKRNKILARLSAEERAILGVQ